MWADRGAGDFIVKVLRQPDGRIVTVVAVIDRTGQPLNQVTRYLPNGAVDTSFGNAGVFTLPVIGAGHVTDAALKPDGESWPRAARSSLPGGPVKERFFVYRVRGNGTNDPSFVAAPANFGGALLDNAFGVALGPSGTIVVAGRGTRTSRIARYTSTGALDHTFSGDGLLTADFHGDAQATDVAVQPDGHIVIGGVAANSPTTDPGDTRRPLRRQRHRRLHIRYRRASVFTGAPLIAVQNLVLQGRGSSSPVRTVPGTADCAVQPERDPRHHVRLRRRAVVDRQAHVHL